MRDYKLIINGEKVDGKKSSIDVINPANETVYSKCPNASVEQLDDAVNAASIAFQTWGNTSHEDRKKLLNLVADKVEENSAELAQIIVAEQGKPISLANIEVGAGIAWIRYTASLDIPVQILEDSDDRVVEMHRKPLGVVASITPWNWPFMIAIWHIIPALRAGNTMVCKPSIDTPLNTIRLVEIMNEVLPKGVINVITAASGIGSAMTKHKGIRKIVFTGSTQTGKTIMADASDTLKRLTLELGGNDAGIVLPNSENLDLIAQGVFQTSFFNMGQTCAALKRLYVHADQYDELCEKLVSIANSQIIGDGIDEDVTFGPLTNQAQLDLVSQLVEDARKNGGKILCGGKRLDQKGYFYEPTIISDVDNSFRVVNEEQFGPVLPIVKYNTIEEAIKMANDSKEGLGGSVWGDKTKAKDIALKLECGTSWINKHAEVLPHVPFGGSKLSGIGIEFGQEGLLEFTQVQILNFSK